MTSSAGGARLFVLEVEPLGVTVGALCFESAPLPSLSRKKSHAGKTKAPSSSCCHTVLKSNSDGLISSSWSTPVQSTKYCCMRRSMNHPSRQAAVLSVCASCRRVANVDPTESVRKCLHSYDMSVRGDRKPNRISVIPAIFSTSQASLWKSLGAVKLSFVIVFMSLSEKLVVVSVVLSCICTKLFV
jgi:hypothetical protein